MGFKITLICDSAHSIRKVLQIIQHHSLHSSVEDCNRMLGCPPLS